MAGQSTAISNPVRRSLWLNRPFLLGVAATIHLVCALESGGWYALDEHFQTIEFAEYKLGHHSTAQLSWEFHHRMRPALQPAVAFAVIRACRALGVDSPFVAAGVLRVGSGLLGAFCMVLLYGALAGRLKSDASRAWFAATSCLLWFLPYLHVRFSSESWAGTFFWTGAAGVILLESDPFGRTRRGSLWLLAGFLLGLSFVARIQAGLLILPVLIWLGLRIRPSVRPMVLTLGGASAALLLGVGLDRWLYGEWTVSAWNYFRVNLPFGAPAYFGSEPWWYYPVRIAERGFYPIGVAILLAGVVYVLARPRDLVTWILIPFLLVHSLIGHKEIRFLFPLVSILPFALVAAAESAASWRRLPAWILSGRIGTGILKATVVFNVAILTVACLKPADPVCSLYSFIYHRYGSRPITLFYDSEDPYARARFTPDLYPRTGSAPDQATPTGSEVVLEARFYKPADLASEPWDHARARALNQTCLYVTRRLDVAPESPGGEFRLVYRYLPDWLMRLNFTGWTARTQIWSVYEVTYD